MEQSTRTSEWARHLPELGGHVRRLIDQAATAQVKAVDAAEQARDADDLLMATIRKQWSPEEIAKAQALSAAEQAEDVRVARERGAMPLCPVCQLRPRQPHGWCDTCRCS